MRVFEFYKNSKKRQSWIFDGKEMISLIHDVRPKQIDKAWRLLNK